MLLSQTEYPLDDLLVQVNFHDDAVGTGKHLVPLGVQGVNEGQHVRPVGNGGRHVPGIVEYRQPGAQAVGGRPDIVGVDLMGPELAQHIPAVAAVIHQAQEGGAQLAVGDVLRHVPADPAVDTLHPSYVSSCGDKRRLRKALDVYKNHADDQNAHISASL